MEDDLAVAEKRRYEAQLDRTIQELQAMKRQLQDAVNELRTSISAENASGAAFSTKDSWEIMTRGYQGMAEAEPLLPSPGSVLPALLAMRSAHQTIVESNSHAESQATTLEKVERQIEAERVNLREQQALQVALRNRLESLRNGQETARKKTKEQIAKEYMAELRQQKAQWDKQTSDLLKQLDWFIEEHLGPMLAAEELGGPVVGDLMEIDPDDLSAGFSAYGKLKKAKDQPDQDRRQRRIDDIWGPQDQQGQPNKRKRERDEASAAAAEMRDLTEQLMNKLMEAGGDNSAAYVKIPKESAAARFLVRSKVAVFHPKDAQRLRLVDFGRDLVD
ncbi:hypothetical protein VTK26DRAFT_98 [Humicola hyalothermophila]